MATDYANYTNTKKTPPKKPIPGREKDMVANNEGGFVFKTSIWNQLNRFLIIGTAGGTYYANQSKISLENIDAIAKCIKENGKLVVNEIVRVSYEGLALRNDQALFVLAMCSCSRYADTDTRRYALANLDKVARIATHLFIFIGYVKKMRGTGRTLNKAVANWYQNKKGPTLAYQMCKYQNRERLSHKDTICFSHPKPKDEEHEFLYAYATGKVIKKGQHYVKLEKVFKDSKINPRNPSRKIYEGEDYTINEKPIALPPGLNVIEGVQLIKEPGISAKRVIQLITDYQLTHEMVPNNHKKDPAVWAALLEHMPIGATLRNLGRMTSIGTLKPMSAATKLVKNRFADKEALQRARIHPIGVLAALKVYSQGRGIKGGLSWTPINGIKDSLDSMFYESFKTIEPTGKRHLLALDVSSSMSWNKVAGLDFMMCSELCAAMAMATARVEEDYEILGFAGNLKDLGITAKDSLDAATTKVSNQTFGSTDCSKPFEYAKKHNWEVDAFFVYTDNETHSGTRHVVQALNDYRQSSGINAVSGVIAGTATNFSIADPEDPGMLDVSGFSADTPKVLAEFVLGKL